MVLNSQERVFGYTLTDKWNETNETYLNAKSHKDVAEKLPLKSVRITNTRYREIEQTGKYYRITENKRGGQAHIYEIQN